MVKKLHIALALMIFTLLISNTTGLALSPADDAIPGVHLVYLPLVIDGRPKPIYIPSILYLKPPQFFLPFIMGPRDPNRPRTWQRLFRTPVSSELLTSLTVGSDGTIYFAAKRGRIYRYRDGVTTLYLDIADEVNSFLDRGLNGIAISPDNRYLYIAYVREMPNTGPDSWTSSEWVLARVSTINPDIQQFVMRGLEITADTHTAAFLKFRNANELFIGIGDDAHNEADDHLINAVRLDSLYGKVLRVNPETGQGIPTNPFWNDDPDSVQSKIYARGFRNPFSGFYEAATDTLFVGDVGNTEWEELNIVRAGLNYGWPCWEANRRHLWYPSVCSDTYPYEHPIRFYRHAGGGAITGVTRWLGRLLVADYPSGAVFEDIPQQPTFQFSYVTNLETLPNQDLIALQYVNEGGTFYGEAQLYTSDPLPPPNPTPQADRVDITITRVTTNTFNAAALQVADGVDVSAAVQWVATMHHNTHIHPDFATGTGPTITLNRLSHPEGWIELCASVTGSNTCIRVD